MLWRFLHALIIINPMLIAITTLLFIVILAAKWDSGILNLRCLVINSSPPCTQVNCLRWLTGLLPPKHHLQFKSRMFSPNWMGLSSCSLDISSYCYKNNCVHRKHLDCFNRSFEVICDWNPTIMWHIHRANRWLGVDDVCNAQKPDNMGYMSCQDCSLWWDSINVSKSCFHLNINIINVSVSKYVTDVYRINIFPICTD